MDKQQQHFNTPSLPILIGIGILLEVLIFCYSYTTQTTIEVTFRLAARYSGRLSFFTFLFTFYLFAKAYPNPITKLSKEKKWIMLFAILHAIHFYFLAMSVYLNKIPLEGIKVIGGALAYIMILTAPILFHKIKPVFHFVYFYYVSIVMSLTYVARIKGDFPGAEPFWYHYVALTVMVCSCIVFGIWTRKKAMKPSNQINTLLL